MGRVPLVPRRARADVHAVSAWAEKGKEEPGRRVCPQGQRGNACALVVALALVVVCASDVNVNDAEGNGSVLGQNQ